MSGNFDDSTLLHFLASEFAKYGLDAPAPNTSPSIRDWSLERDEAGFTLSTSADAYARLKAYLEQVFSVPKFDDTGTLIYRNDDKHTTVMLNSGESTQLIVLHWCDAAVRSKIERARLVALEELFDRWRSEVEALIADAEAASDETEQAAILEEVTRKIEELISASNSTDISTEDRP